MTSFNINKSTHKSAQKQEKIRKMTKSPNENEAKVAAKKLRPSAAISLPLKNEYEPSLVQKILDENGCACEEPECNNTPSGKKCPKHGTKDCSVKEEKDPKGPVQSYKTPKEIAKKHGVSLEQIKKQLEMGIKVEGEHTSDKTAAKITALQHLDEVPDYYTKLKKVESKKKTTSESVTIEDMFGNKFIEFIDLIKPEDIIDEKLGLWDRIHNRREKGLPRKKPGQKGYPKTLNVENHIDVAMGKELDDEGSMILNQLNQLEMHCKRMKGVIRDPKMQVPAWVQSKVTLATDYMDAVANYMSSKNEEFVGEGKKESDSYLETDMKKRRENNEKAIEDMKKTKAHKDMVAAARKKLIGEAIRLPSEFGHLISVSVAWRGKPQQIITFFPQAKMPTRKEVQFEIEKIYPGGKVISFAATDLPSNYSQILRVGNQGGSSGRLGPNKNYVKPMGEEAELEEGKTPITRQAGDFRYPGRTGEEKAEARAKRLSKSQNPTDRRRANKIRSRVKTAADRDIARASSDARQKLYQGQQRRANDLAQQLMKKESVNEDVHISGGNVGSIIIGGESPKKSQEVGEHFTADVVWKGRLYNLEMVLEGGQLPSRRELGEQLQDEYPGAVVQNVYPSTQKGSIKVTSAKHYNHGTLSWIDEDWQSVNRKDKTDGLSQKAVNTYRRENPGSKLQTAVTEKKPKGKRAKRRSSFCSRMKGMKSKLTSSKTARDPDSRINKALRRWNCR